MPIARPIPNLNELKTGASSSVSFRNPALNFGGQSLANAAQLATGVMGILSNLISGKQSIQRAYNWEVLFPDMGLIGMNAIGAYCQDVSFGPYNMQEINRIRYGSEKRGYAGNFEVNTFKAKFIKPVPDIVQTYFDIWKSLIVDASGFRYLKNNYALSVYIKLYGTDGIESGSYKLIGVFPKTFPEHSLSYTAEGVAQYELEFNVDKSFVW